MWKKLFLKFEDQFLQKLILGRFDLDNLNFASLCQSIMYLTCLPTKNLWRTLT